MGGNAMPDEAERYLIGKDVYFDTSYVLDKMPQEQFVRMVRNHGVDKILFASDSPWACQKYFVQRLLSMDLDVIEKKKILSHNARTLLHV
jgi:predicted TIM-barrel fold metal-dependent hydrolase